MLILVGWKQAAPALEANESNESNTLDLCCWSSDLQLILLSQVFIEGHPFRS